MNAPRIISGISLALGLATACTTEAKPQAATKTDAKVDAKGDAEAEPDPPADAEAEPGKIPVLTAEDERLIAADPKTLTVEERRKRAYAMRRKIMQNPDSETAKMLEDLRRAAENGEIQPGVGGTPTFHTRTAPDAAPAGGSPPAGAPDPAPKAP